MFVYYNGVGIINGLLGGDLHMHVQLITQYPQLVNMVLYTSLCC